MRFFNEHKSKLAIFLIGMFFYSSALAQTGFLLPQWKLQGTTVVPRNASSSVRIDSLGSAGNPCLTVSATGTIATSSCGTSITSTSSLEVLSVSSTNSFSINSTTTNLAVTGLTADRLIRTITGGILQAVATLTDWITGGTGIRVDDDGDGTVTIVNEGVTSIVAGANISIDQGTSTVTITGTASGGGDNSQALDATSSPTFVTQTLTGASGGFLKTNSAGLIGTSTIALYPDVELVSSSAVSANLHDVLKWNGSQWVAVPEGTVFSFSIASFTDNNSSPQEIGTGQWEAIGGISFSATYNNGPATTCNVTMSGAGNSWTNKLALTNGCLGATTNTEAVTHRSSVGSITWTLTATTTAESDTQNVSVSFQNRRHWGVTTKTSGYTSADIGGFDSNQLSNSRAKTFTVTAGAGEYIVYSYRTALGTATFTVGGFEGGFQAPETVSRTNDSGFVENFYVYRSTNANLGTVEVVVS
jgi:hypothetical protein|tara:strand:- start:9140 stop:10558 length:1419 start_codon:yes stop_codon:yes gene_type:complete